MRIAVLAWGSLVWDRRSIGIAGDFEPTGPRLPIEFCRISGGGRLTLVVDEALGTPCVTYAALSAFGDLGAAIEDLRVREGMPTTKAVGFIELSSQRESTVARRRPPNAMELISAWARRTASMQCFGCLGRLRGVCARTGGCWSLGEDVRAPGELEKAVVDGAEPERRSQAGTPGRRPAPEGTERRGPARCRGRCPRLRPSHGGEGTPADHPSQRSASPCVSPKASTRSPPPGHSVRRRLPRSPNSGSASKRSQAKGDRSVAAAPTRVACAAIRVRRAQGGGVAGVVEQGHGLASGGAHERSAGDKGPGRRRWAGARLSPAPGVRCPAAAGWAFAVLARCDARRAARKRM